MEKVANYKRLTIDEKEYLRHLYFDEKQSIPMISKLTKRHPKTIHYWLKEFGTVRNYSEAQLLANRLKRGQGIKNRLHQNAVWGEGRYKTPFGYIMKRVRSDEPFFCMGIKKDRATRYVFEHRLVMAEHLGRPLTEDELVHHLNGIKGDNRIENLAVVTCHNHPRKTLLKLAQKRIRDLEAELAQQKLL